MSNQHRLLVRMSHDGHDSYEVRLVFTEQELGQHYSPIMFIREKFDKMINDLLQADSPQDEGVEHD